MEDFGEIELQGRGLHVYFALDEAAGSARERKKIELVRNGAAGLRWADSDRPSVPASKQIERGITTPIRIAYFCQCNLAPSEIGNGPARTSPASRFVPDL